MVIDPGNGINTRNTIDTGKTAKSQSTDKNSVEPKGDPSSAGAHTSSDNVSLSAAGQNLAKLATDVAAAPEIDQQRVDDIRASLASGSYSMDAAATASKMLDQDQLL